MTSSFRFEEAHRLYQKGAFSQCLALLRQAPCGDREGREGLLLQGACLARLRRAAEAVDSLTRLLAIDPECHEALTWMSALTRDPKDMTASLDYARRAVALRTEDASGYGALGTGYLAAQRPEPATEALRRAVELAPDVAEHRHNLALAHLMAHRHGEAIAQLREAVRLAPEAPQSRLLLASSLSLFGMVGPAIECLSEGLPYRPNDASLHSALGAAFAAIRNDEAAERHHRRAVSLSPEGRNAYATWLLNQGRFDEANAIFTALLSEGNDPGFAFYGLMQSRKLTESAEDTEFVGEMVNRLESGALSPRGEMYLRYALGRAEEQRRRDEVAMGHFDAANALASRIYHGGRPVAPSRFADEGTEARRLFTSIGSRPSPSDSPEAPIFIVGMIRSGTTLLDQIVSSHPAVASGGEMRFWMEEARRLITREAAPRPETLRELAEEYVRYARLLAGPAERFTDKMPLNFAYAGLIHVAMPNARLVHIRRNPIDTCLSIWTTFFGQGPLFAYDKTNVVAFYREYLRTMAFWRDAIPSDRLLEIDYEELVADARTVVPRIVEFCGLPWDENCLRHDQNDRAINTPSRWQARQPIYATSVARWRRYEPWLGAFRELLDES